MIKGENGTERSVLFCGNVVGLVFFGSAFEHIANQPTALFVLKALIAVGLVITAYVVLYPAEWARLVAVIWGWTGIGGIFWCGLSIALRFGSYRANDIPTDDFAILFNPAIAMAIVAISLMEAIMLRDANTIHS